MLPLLLPFGQQTPTNPPISVAYVQLIKPVTQPKFPDFTSNYISTVVIPQQQAAQAALEALEAPPPPKPVIHTTPGHFAAPAPLYTGSLASWLLALRTCESGGNYAENTGNGFYGAYQFSISTWNHWQTGYARADLAPPGVQDATIIANTNASAGLVTQNPGCYRSTGISNKPPAS